MKKGSYDILCKHIENGILYKMNVHGYLDTERGVAFGRNEFDSWNVTDLKTGMSVIRHKATQKECREEIERVWGKVVKLRSSDIYRSYEEMFQDAKYLESQEKT